MLELSTKYALKALLHLAGQDHDHFTQVRSLSQVTNIPGPYLSKIVKELAAKGIVETRRGSAGGVRLPDRPLSFFDVCTALDDPIVSHGCFLNRHACDSAHPCIMHAHWGRIKAEVAGFLKESKIV